MTALRLPTGLLEEIPPFRSASLSEATLLRGYATGAGDHPSLAMDPVVEPCACGEAIAVYPGQRLEEVVAVHVRGIRHRTWSNATRVR